MADSGRVYCSQLDWLRMVVIVIISVGFDSLMVVYDNFVVIGSVLPEQLIFLYWWNW